MDLASSPPAQNWSHFAFDDDFSEDWNASYGPEDYSYSGMEAAAPCYSCGLLAASALPFYVLASVLGALASAAVFFALLRPRSRWRLLPGWPVLAQVAAGSALFSLAVPLLAPGLSTAHHAPLCHLARGVWHSAAFAQALLISGRACLGPRLGADRTPRLALGLAVGLWGVAVLLGLPVTLATDTSHGLCTLTFQPGSLQIVHTATCVVIFVLLPLGLLGAKGLTKGLGRGPCPWADVLWLWFVFWWPHGVLQGLDSLVRSKVFVWSSCAVQQAVDQLLDLAEALAILHCVATPLLLAVLWRQATRASSLSLPLPGSPNAHLDALGGKS